MHPGSVPAGSRGTEHRALRDFLFAIARGSHLRDGEGPHQCPVAGNAVLGIPEGPAVPDQDAPSLACGPPVPLDDRTGRMRSPGTLQVIGRVELAVPTPWDLRREHPPSLFEMKK